MQKPVAWLVGGLALTGLAGMLPGLADQSSGAAGHLELYLPALIAGAAGQFCLWRGMRSGLGALWSGLWSRGVAREPAKRSSATLGASDSLAAIGDDHAPSDFDADAVFARYMERRADEVPQTAPVTPVRAATPPAPASRPAPRPAFGRKVV
jgi:hypothetical protein